MKTRSFEKLEEAAEEIYSKVYRNVDEMSLNIIPPAPDVITDEEEYEDDNIRCNFMPLDVPGAVEIEVTSDDNDDSDDEIPIEILAHNIEKEAQTSKRQKSNSGVKYTEAQKPKWRKTNPTFSKFEFYNDSYTENYETMIKEIEKLSPIQIFEKLFSEDVFQLIIDQSIIYAAQKNHHGFKISAIEVRTFIGILILTGYISVPQERMYWSNDEDLAILSIKLAMTRDRFLEIKRFLHLADNSKMGSSSDRMYKLRPLTDLLTKNFCQWGVFHRDLSIDESMVKYFGGHPAKQFIRGKPVRFGYKNWVLSSSSGYCYMFNVYCGKGNDTRQVPLGAHVVLTFMNQIADPERHIVFFDNYFSTFDLLVTLKEKGIKATGTIRENRLRKCPLPTNKDFGKKQRGVYDWRFDTQNEIVCVRWKDNSVCTMISNYDSIQPIKKIKRWSKEAKKKVDIEQPNLFTTYNTSMGGVDIMDQAISNYRISIRGKKWWWVLFTYFVDLSVVNAWKLHCLSTENPMTLLLFRRTIARCYLSESASQPKRRGPPSSKPSGLQYDGTGHFPKKIPKQLRCCYCRSRVRWQCKKCQKTLCVEKSCFELYHTNQ